MSRNEKLLKLSDETQKTANQERLHQLNQISIHPNSSHQPKKSITLYQCSWRLCRKFKIKHFSQKIIQNIFVGIVMIVAHTKYRTIYIFLNSLYINIYLIFT